VVFSKPTNAVETPAALMRERQLQQPVEVKEMGQSSMSVDLPVTSVNAPAVAPNRMLQEMMDRQRNWAFLTPYTAFPQPLDAEADPMLALSRQTQAPKRTVELYLESQNRAATPANNSLNLRKGFNAVGSNPRGGSDLRAGLPNARLDLALDQSFSIGSLSSPIDKLRDMGSLPNSVLSPIVYSTATPQSEESSRSTPDIASPLRSKRPITALDQAINLLPDLTSESIQPTVGRNPANTEPNESRFNGFDVGANGGRTERRYQDILTTRVLGSSSLSPAIAGPTDNRIMSQPAVLEIPKRKF
jgi:hypothetical protein